MNYNIIGELDISSLNDVQQLIDYLFKNFTSLKRDAYDVNDRIRVVIGDHDYYKEDQIYGHKLKLIQEVIDSVDITSCFVTVVTTNPDIKREIDQLQDISQDKNNKLDYEILHGTYSRLSLEKNKDYLYKDTVPTRINLNELSEKEKFWLTESKVFCMYPWIHINASPNGEAQPCCVWDHSKKMCSAKEQSLEQIYNNPQWRELRLNMMNEKPTAGCEPCYEQERNGFFSNRQSSNKHHGHHITRATKTHEDGTSDTFKMTYWDIRFSNLCNLSCRSCGHIFSSSWYQDQKSLAGPEWGKKNKALFWAGRYETDMLEQLMEHIDYVEQIYFAGGEPLIMDEHYAILEELERRKKFNVRLVYNTNFTKTKLKDRYVFDYWRKFDSVSVGASLDAMGPRAEYIRRGTDWEEVEENRMRMLDICPSVDFYISPTLSLQNAWHLPDFHRDWVNKGLIRPKDLHVNPLLDPAWLRADIAPEDYRKKVIAKYKQHLEWLRPNDELERATQGFESAIHLMEKQHPDSEELMKNFWKRMGRLDELRNEDMLSTIPELNELTQ